VSGLSGVTARARYDAFRLVVLALTLLGFVAMHGLASAGSDSSHCAAPDTLISPVDHDRAAHDRAAHDLTGASMIGGGAATRAGAHSNPAAHSAVDSPVASPGQTGDDGEKLMTGCLLALLGALAALALRLVRLAAGHTTPTPAASASLRQRAARAPPQPLFLSLRVIRL
jgi:hypothetical protein